MDKQRILFIDDDESFLDIMSQRLESWGYEVIQAASGEEAFKLFTSEKPDAIIVDFILPDINGVQLLMKIRAFDEDIPVIMFTAQPSPETMEDADTLNISAFVPKLSPYVDTQASLRSALKIVFKKKDIR